MALTYIMPFPLTPRLLPSTVLLRKVKAPVMVLASARMRSRPPVMVHCSMVRLVQDPLRMSITPWPVPWLTTLLLESRRLWVVRPALSYQMLLAYPSKMQFFTVTDDALEAAATLNALPLVPSYSKCMLSNTSFPSSSPAIAT